ncbi:putative siderophore transport system ATP-binding protein YusV [bioreactor metagenome]|uniref:Putative siderophore transport system ATP-binding protein YusV n=1 Tax=bioreactor metagenome TaxID=1076179 RepID=A0A644TN26_9ZZZZ|nr:ABC transporter ATP-binding protein [Acidaminococcaceae bacterium]
MNILDIKNITVELSDKVILRNMNLSIVNGEVLSIIGPNGCGKSTLLKTIARVIRCKSGSVEFEGTNVQSFSHRQFAQRLAILTQDPEAPPDLTVYDLVKLGRFPYRSWYSSNAKEDEEQVAWALAQTGMEQMKERLLVTLSGGERQRAWIAMALAQRPKVLLLDEPTTYLDICHQLEVMQLLRKLNRELGLTVVMVLHDLNHTLQYSQRIAVIKAGQIIKVGEPQEVINDTLLKDVFRVKADIFMTSNGMQAILPIDLIKI